MAAAALALVDDAPEAVDSELDFNFLLHVQHAYRHEYIQCRTYGHAWDPHAPKFIPGAPVWKYRMELHCMRCTMQRLDALNAYGEVVYRRYVPPEGYRYAIDELPTSDEFRLLVLGVGK